MQNNNYLRKRDAAGTGGQLYVPDLDTSYDGYYDATLPEQSEKQTLLRILSIVRKYWSLIAAITLLGTSAVVIYEAQKPDFYQASTRIQVNNETNPGAGGADSSSIILNPGNDPAYFTTQLQILEGSGMLRRVVKVLDLENNDAFFNPMKGRQTTVWQNVKRMFGLYKPPAPAKEVAVVGSNNKTLVLKTDAPVDLDSQAEALAPYVSFLKNGLDVSPVRDSRTASKETRLIEVEFTHQDPQIAAKVVNSIADVYVLQNLERKVETNASAGDFLQKRVAELQSDIKLGEERLLNYAQNNQILSLDSSQNTVVQRLSDLNARLSAAEGERINAETTYRAALQNPMREAVAENKDARTTGLETQLTGLRQRLVTLKTEYTDDWPEVIQVRGQIAAIEQELKVTKRRSSNVELAGLEQAYRQAAAKERELRAYFDEQRRNVLTQNEAAVNYRIIQQEIDTNKGLLSNLLPKLRETEVVLEGTPNNVHVVDSALVPRNPAGPQRSKNVMIAFFASLFVGLGLAFALSWLDDTVRANDDLELLLGTPVIGMIPGAGLGLTKRLISRAKGNDSPRIGKDAYPLDSFNKPIIAEAFNQLRTSLLLSTAGGAPQTILVTSGQPAEGKTLTSLNLAKSLAQLGNKVLLVDADLRSPKMHLLHNLNNRFGLSNLLTAKGLNDETIHSTIHKDIDENLDLLSSGPNVPSPSNLFSAPEMRDLLNRLKVPYSYIVIDSPPVLYFADSVVLSTCVDAAVLIARANVSSRDILARAKKALQDVRVNIVGVVLNGIPNSGYKYYNNKYYRELEKAEAAESSTGSLHLRD